MTSSVYDDDLRFALTLADQVDRITMSRFKAIDLKVESKPDTTPVSDADRTAEEVIRGQISRMRSRDAIVGEEYGTTGHSSRRWIIDPIDGTKNFVRGVPVWATLIALAEGDEVVVGVVSAPALNRRWWAAKGTGAWTGRSLSQATRLHVSGVSSLEDASLSYSSLGGWGKLGLREQFLSLTDDVSRTRAYGDFWSYMLVAEGAVDAAMEPELELYDMAALVPIVTEAGGTFTSVDGSAQGPWGGNAIASNGVLHEEILERLRTE
jgi:histidinol-phosphatase